MYNVDQHRDENHIRNPQRIQMYELQTMFCLTSRSFFGTDNDDDDDNDDIDDDDDVDRSIYDCDNETY